MNLINKKRKFRKNKGFTFLEVLVVVIVIGILIGASLPAYLYTVEDTRTRKKEAAIQRVMEAKTKFYNADRTAAADTPIPTTADIAPYLILDPTEAVGVGGTATTNSFISNHSHCIFPDCFPKNEVWVLQPKGRFEKPEFVKISP
jgi:prepilin-type N-terminal cleavage/methylation domain-containing protein